MSKKHDVYQRAAWIKITPCLPFNKGFWVQLHLFQISIVMFIPRRLSDESNPAASRQYFAM